MHDYLTQRGGAERVVLSMHRAFPEAPIYTSLFRPETTFPEFQAADVRTLPLNLIPGLRRYHRLALPLLAPAFSSIFVKADVVICSSSGWAHATPTNGRKVVYCHTPARWLYQTDRYIGRGRWITRFLFALIRPLLVRWDRRAAKTADRYVTQSTTVRERIRNLYDIDAQMLPAPHTVRIDVQLRPISGVEPGYFLCVSRLLPYKNLDAVISAFGELPDLKLLLVGDGPERACLSRGAGKNVKLLGSVADEELAWLYTHAQGIIAAAHEDYGLVPIEAAAFGRPTAALRWGGYLDTVREGITGVFFESPKAPAIAQAVRELQAAHLDDAVIRAHAEQYSEDRFIERLRQIVTAEMSLTP